MRLLYFILYSFLTFTLAINFITLESGETYYLTSGIIYYFTITIDWFNSIEITLKMSKNYNISDLVDLNYSCHDYESLSENGLNEKQKLEVSESQSSTQTILNSKIDTSHHHNDLVTLIISSNKNLNITIYFKKNEDEEVDIISILILFIPIGFCIIIIIGSISGIYYCCKRKKTVNAGPSSAQQPLDPQPLYPQ